MPSDPTRRSGWLDYAKAALAVVTIALLGAPLLGQFDLANIAMLFPLAVLFAAIRLGRGPAVFAAFLSVALFDFFFVHPHFTLAVSDLQYLLTFAVLLAVALTTAELAARLRRERDSAETRGEEAARARLAVESERLRNTLLASLSHDLRTPLTALAGLAESLPLAGPPLPPAQAALAEAIRTEALRTHALARDLLDLARLQSDAPHLALDWIAADELVGSAVQSRAHALCAHALTLDLPDDLPLLRADAVLMERVLCNLLDNAAAHTPPGGRITVTARCTADGITPDGAPAWLAIDFCDDGCGLPPGREQAIFERFVRGADPGRARTTGDEGTGLGLTLVRAIIEAHGGSVAARNRPSGGACFTLQMPLPPQPEPPPPEATALTAGYQA
jgi:two-component system sensor histidine kinase KdpD